MKTLNKTLGVISVAVLLIGMVFKKFHWPGASILILISGLGVLAFYVAFVIAGPKPLAKGIEKTSAIVGGLAMCIVAIGMVMKIQHWAGASILVYISDAGLLLTGILLIIAAIKETDPARQSIKTYAAFTIFVLALIMAFISLPPS